VTAEPVRAAVRVPALEPRCSDTSRARGESPIATAPPARRLLLVEVPGAWGRAGLTSSRLPREITAPLAASADAAGVRVQLVRRPGRHPGPLRPAAISTEGGHIWALADPRAGVVRWGTWARERDLLDIDLAERLDPRVHAATGPQRLVLVCTHARHDVCCALRGRPVAKALVGADVDRQVWETSHLGGDRFAANAVLLPEGEVFGGLDADSAVRVVQALDGGRVDLAHSRGRIGEPPVVQAARTLAAQALDDDRLGAVRVLAVDAVGAATAEGRRHVARIDADGAAYRLELLEWWAPAERLTCAAVEAKAARRFTLITLERSS
jgi:hypothetical protein